MSIDISKLTVNFLTVIAAKWTKTNHSGSTAVQRKKSFEMLQSQEYK